MDEENKISKNHFVVFTINRKKFALPVNFVENVIPLVKITTVNSFPDNVLGTIVFHGEVIPVLDIIKILGLKSFSITLTSQIILLRRKSGLFAFIVDEVYGYVETQKEDLKEFEKEIKKIGKISGILVLDDADDVLVQNPEEFLSRKEEEKLEEELRRISQEKKNNDFR
jgi:chemotaxis signal transduction protein